MRKFLKIVKAVFIAPRTPSTLLDGLPKRMIATPYEPGLINGTFQRGRGIKIWTVTVRTCEPDQTLPNHAAWMLNVMVERSAIVSMIGELQRYELLYNANQYRQGVRGYRIIQLNKLNNH